MQITQEETNLPYFQTLNDLANYIQKMPGENSGIFNVGLAQEFQSLSFSRAQIGILENSASQQLSKELEHYLLTDSPVILSKTMETAFWHGPFKAAEKITDPATPQDQRLYAAVHLYAMLNASIHNARLFFPENEGKKGEFALRNEFKISSDMPAHQTLFVLKRGLLPQLANLIQDEFGIDRTRLSNIQKGIYHIWNNEPETISALKMLKPIPAAQWLKTLQPGDLFEREEILQAQADQNRFLAPPGAE